MKRSRRLPENWESCTASTAQASLSCKRAKVAPFSPRFEGAVLTFAQFLSDLSSLSARERPALHLGLTEWFVVQDCGSRERPVELD